MISSLGLIEVVGLVGAVEAGDTAVKAAVDAAVMAVEKLTTVVSHLVIARPSEEVAKMIESTEEQCECSCESKETETLEVTEEKIVAENIVEEKIEEVEVIEEIEAPLKKK